MMNDRGHAPSMWAVGGDEEESSLRNHRTPLLSHGVLSFQVVIAQPEVPPHRSGKIAKREVEKGRMPTVWEPV